MNRFFGDESFPVHKAAATTNKSSEPYDYEKEFPVQGFNKAEAWSLVGSVAFSLVVAAGFIHADEVKDTVKDVIILPAKIEEQVVDGFSELVLR